MAIMSEMFACMPAGNSTTAVLLAALFISLIYFVLYKCSLSVFEAEAYLQKITVLSESVRNSSMNPRHDIISK